jgi:hypothetical protein
MRRAREIEKPIRYGIPRRIIPEEIYSFLVVERKTMPEGGQRVRSSFVILNGKRNCDWKFSNR